MRFNIGPTKDEKRASLYKWHRFYPYFPRYVGNGEVAMFEPLERRKVANQDGDKWEYRLPLNSKAS